MDQAEEIFRLNDLVTANMTCIPHARAAGGSSGRAQDDAGEAAPSRAGDRGRDAKVRPGVSSLSHLPRHQMA
eukprot:759669-Hanusia_phi.AAC.4